MDTKQKRSQVDAIIIPTLLGAIAGSGKFNIIENEFPELKCRLTGYTSDGFYFGGYYSDPMGCTLLARSVDSMTAEEMYEVPFLFDTSFSDEMTLRQFLYLISIGVLPKKTADLLPMKVEWV